MTITLRYCLVALAALAAASVQAGPTRLQVFVTKDEARARAEAARLDSAGFGPAAVAPAGALFKVQTRAYDSLAEANFVRPALRGQGWVDVFAVEETAEKAPGAEHRKDQPPAAGRPAEAAAPVAQAAVPDLGNLGDSGLSVHIARDYATGTATTSGTSLAIKPTNPAGYELRKGYKASRAGKSAEARAIFSAIVEQSAGLPEAGEARLRIAYMDLREGREIDALRGFYAVASGQITATDEARSEAALRTAAMYHRGKDLDSAAAVFAALEKSAGNPEVKAFARMQRAGLTLEKAWNGKASFADARAICDSVLADYPGSSKMVRATATVMALETLSYEKNPRGVLAREAAALKEIEGTAEAALAYYWLGKARLDSGDLAGGAQVLEAVAEAQFPVGERFRQVDVTTKARGLAADAYDKLGNPAKAQAIRRK